MPNFRFAFSFFALAIGLSPTIHADEPDELRALQVEIREAHQSMEQVVRQLQQLERRLETLQGKLNAPAVPAEDFSTTWKDLLSIEAMGMAFGERTDAGQTIAVCDANKVVHVLRRENGGWLPEWKISLDSPGAPRMVVRDLTGDGESEVIISTHEVVIYKRMEDGYHPVWRSLENFHPTPAPRVEVADFNGDGRMDLAVLNWQDDQKAEAERGEGLHIYTRTLSRRMEYGLSEIASLTDEDGFFSAAGMAVGDFTGSGSPQVLLGNDAGCLWLGKFEQGRLKFGKGWKLPGGGAIGANLAVGDLCSDPRPEVAIATNGGQLFVVGADSDGVLQLLATAAAGPLPYSISTANFVGEEKSQILVSRGLLGFSGLGEQDLLAEIWRVNDDSQLQRIWQQPTVDAPRSVAQDLNADGRAEVIIYSAKGSQPKIEQPKISVELGSRRRARDERPAPPPSPFWNEDRGPRPKANSPVLPEVRVVPGVGGPEDDSQPVLPKLDKWGNFPGAWNAVQPPVRHVAAQLHVGEVATALRVYANREQVLLERVQPVTTHAVSKLP